MAVTFDISPEKEASKLQYYRRQFFVTPPATSAKDVDLKGKTAIVTGSNSGIGLECARQLLDLGLSKLILGVRDETKGNAAVANLSAGRNLQQGHIELWKLDLGSYDSVTSFAERASRLDSLHLVILNAGIYRLKMQINSSTGHEEDIQTNYLSTALLALLFLRVLKTKNPPTSPGRIVITSSDTAAWAKFPERGANPLLPAFDDKSAKWDMQERYSTSKLLQQLFLTELVKRVPPSAVVINAVNPGCCYGSGLARDVQGTLLGFAVALMLRLEGRPPKLGARSLVNAAVKQGPESHGQYVEDGKLTPMAPIVYKAEGERVAQQLWEETMQELSFAGVQDILRDMGAAEGTVGGAVEGEGGIVAG